MSPSQEIESIIKEMPYPWFSIPESVTVYRAQRKGVPVATYAPKSSVSHAFSAIAEHLVTPRTLP